MTKTLRICIDRWVTVQVETTENNEFVSELLHGGHDTDDQGVIHVRSNATSEGDRCGWYAARRIIRDHKPRNRTFSLDFHVDAERDDYYCRYEGLVSREMSDLDLPGTIEKALTQREIFTLKDLLKHYDVLEDQARNPIPRHIAPKTTTPLGKRSIETILSKLKELRVVGLAGYAFGSDADTRLVIADRFAEQQVKR